MIRSVAIMTRLRLLSSTSNNKIGDVGSCRTSTTTHHPNHNHHHHQQQPPPPPPPDFCCGSGCQHCVWIEYGEQLIAYYDSNALEQTLAKIDIEITDPSIRAYVETELRMIHAAGGGTTTTNSDLPGTRN